jgi:hypothetical protein
MQFVIDRDSLESVPAPASDRVTTKPVPPRIVAAYRFSGFPFDGEVVDALRKLRDLLARDGYQTEEGYQLCR